MKEVIESLAATFKFTGGVALLFVPAAVPLLLFGGLVAVGRGYWGRGTESRQWARNVLASGDADDLDLALARDIIEFY